MEYFKAAVAALALVSIASALAPAREGVRRATLSALSVILLLLLIPRTGALDLSSLFTWDSDSTTTDSAPVYSEAWQAGVENGIRDDLSARFSLPRESVSVAASLAFTEEEVKITHLSLTLSGDAALGDATGMLLYIEKSYGVYAEIHLKAQ